MSPTRHLDLLVAANLLATIAHFSDNAARFARYPEPSWITGPGVVVALWVTITPALLAGWWLARHGRAGTARIALQLYAAASLLVLGHYAYPAPAPLAPSMHAGITLNAGAALTLLIFSPSILRRMRTQASTNGTHV